MALSRRTQLYLFLGLVAVLAAVWIGDWGRSSQRAAAFSLGGKYIPLKVQDPALRLDLLERARELSYEGSHRNIFSARPPAPPPPKVEPGAVQSAASTPGSAAPLPLAVPFKFYGIVTDPRTGKRRGCFTDGEEISIVAEGGVIQGRFRLLKIGNDSAEVEEIGTSRRATIPLDVSAGPPG